MSTVICLLIIILILVIVTLWVINSEFSRIRKRSRMIELENDIRWRMIYKKLKITDADRKEAALEVDTLLGSEARVSLDKDLQDLLGNEYRGWVGHVLGLKKP